MSTGDRSEFLWSDAWLFPAFALAAADEPASIARVLPLADGIQHAIPTKEEVDGALVRLTRAGYVQFETGRVSITSSGKAVLRKAELSGTGLLTQQKALEHLLAARPWTARYDPRGAGGDETPVVADEDWSRAIAQYRLS